MLSVGTSSQPLRVAIVGAGPAAFYAAEHLLKQPSLVVEVDMFDRLPAPHGLVRYGVAPDHPKIKTVTRAYDAIASNPRFRFYGNVALGQHVTLDDLRRHFHQVLLATGAQTDRRMGIPGEDLSGSHPATEFVAWYNGHPDFRGHQFDLSVERAAVVGVGNVAIDVARMLVRTPEELEATDTADYALEALSASRIREVFLLGRRGPVQAAFTTPEIKEIGEMAGAEVIVRPEEVQLDPLSQAELDAADDRMITRKVEVLQGYALRRPQGRDRRLHVRFLVSPVEVIGDGSRVTGIRLVRNTLVAGADGKLSARPTGEIEELPVGLVFRSVGYRGVPVPGAPFNDAWGVIPNQSGRVVDESGTAVTGLYATGWIKRGPSGVIGTNKPDAVETVTAMIEDVGSGRIGEPPQPDRTSMDTLVRERQPDAVSYDEWRRLDGLEISNGKSRGRPRLKFTTVEQMLSALGRAVTTK